MLYIFEIIGNLFFTNEPHTRVYANTPTTAILQPNTQKSKTIDESLTQLLKKSQRKNHQ